MQIVTAIHMMQIVRLTLLTVTFLFIVQCVRCQYVYGVCITMNAMYAVFDFTREQKIIAPPIVMT